MHLNGIHHITALASDPQRNADFYTGVLGMRMVKRTVNFDAPDVYHLYYGDRSGTPGTLMTFFPFPHAGRGTRGAGEISAVAWRVPAASMDYWLHRLSVKGVHIDGPSTRFGREVISFLDPDGMHVELVFADGPPVDRWPNGPVPPEHQLATFDGVTMSLHEDGPSVDMLTRVLRATEKGTEGRRRRFTLGNGDHEASIDLVVDPTIGRARQSAGSVHHIAWRVSDAAGQLAWRERLVNAGVHVTEVIDRQYFESIYFREPGGILYEIATDPPGMTVDEELERLGERLQLPAWFEPDRARIEAALPPLAGLRPTSTMS